MMKKPFFYLFFLALCLTAAPQVNAQIQTPAASPAATMKQTVGLTDVTIEYSRPSAKKRAIFGANGIVPYGQIWRTGANQATKFTFSEDVTIGGQKLKGGSYALLTKPAAEQWEVMLFTYETGDWTSYTSKTPAAKFMAKPAKSGFPVETFLIVINNVSANAATIDLMWENTLVSLPLEVNVDSKVMANIDRVMAGPSAGDYYNAASYYHDAGKDIKKAYEWVKKANEMQPRFWTLRKQSLIEADLGLVKEAIATAEKSKALAKEAGNNEYVQMNEKSIAEWSKKKM